MSQTTTTRNATLSDLDGARHGQPLWARFRNGITGGWTDGYLVGWTQGKQPWVCGRFADTDSTFEECSTYQYCEVYTDG